jgi:hypothetical protein
VLISPTCFINVASLSLWLRAVYTRTQIRVDVAARLFARKLSKSGLKRSCTSPTVTRVRTHISNDTFACTFARFEVKAKPIPEMVNSAQTSRSHGIYKSDRSQSCSEKPQFALCNGQGGI